ncbi:EI24 domain-containing protein [Qipengyuania algicida]|uniref:EI24 domain-containing protein n=1 Tax=Qipengyuania algicida TaxID=1836209 RepID=UPI001927BDED|nr:EI24 domain-containing protein [Qipengyuania algicida]
MTNLPRALALSLAQLGDPAIVRVLLKSLLVTLALFGVFGAVLWFAAAHTINAYAAGYGTGLGAVLGLVLMILAGWLLFRVVALAVLQFFADEIVQAVEARHYPAAAQVAGLPFMRELGASLRALMRTLIVNLVVTPIALALLVTGIGTALVYGLANAFLLGRELMDMVWLRHRRSDADTAPIGGLTRFALGGIVTVMLVVPFINFLAPVLGAAAATHLVHRQRSPDAPL